MKKIYIVGSVASGKTTMAKILSQQLKIPFYELDCIVHIKTKNGRYKRTAEEQAEEINRINQNSGWIFEGVYRQSYKYILDLADEIIFLDPSLQTRRFRIIFRFLKQKLHIEACHYKSDIKMLKLMFKWLNDFENNRQEFEKLLENHKHKVVYVTNIKEYKIKGDKIW